MQENRLTALLRHATSKQPELGNPGPDCFSPAFGSRLILNRVDVPHEAEFGIAVQGGRRGGHWRSAHDYLSVNGLAEASIVKTSCLLSICGVGVLESCAVKVKV